VAVNVQDEIDEFREEIEHGQSRKRRVSKKKGRQWKLPAKKKRPVGSDVRLGLTQALHAIAHLPHPALPEQFHSLEALEDVAFNDETGRTLEAVVL
jgi:hypothetical protein